ncbi:MAG: YicC family protein [Deltaproteobacteria bacterium]|nr:YicC family protein [Deltaproteobacteria bacterium]
MPALSMTGFGKGSAALGNTQIDVEIRTVNHRFLDISCKLPSLYSSYENDMVAKTRSLLKRGKVDIAVARNFSNKCRQELKLNQELFLAYWKAFHDACKIANVKSPASISAEAVLSILSRRDVLDVSAIELNPEEERGALFYALESALKGVCEMRSKEGEGLTKEILNLTEQLEDVVKKLSQLAQVAPQDYKERLTLRLSKILPDNVEIDPSRLAQEVAILADKIDIQEELARLMIHLKQFEVLFSQDATGRKLDFLIQEMGREINTSGSKAQNSSIQILVVEAKAILEKVREQVQNIE